MTANTVFADDQVIIFITEDKLQKTAYKWNKIIIEYGLHISAHKTKLMVFKDVIQLQVKL
jgi:hypothetical protein